MMNGILYIKEIQEMKFKIHNVIENKDGSAILDIDISDEFRAFVRKYYKRKHC